MNKVSLLIFLVVSLFALPESKAEKPNVYTLGKLLELAARHNFVQASKEEAVVAEARLEEAESGLYPKFKLSAFIAPSPDVDCENPECSVTAQRNATLDLEGIFGGARADLVQPLYTFGKLSAVKKAAGVAATAARIAVQERQGQIGLRTAQAYFGLKLAKELRAMLQEGKNQLDKAFTLVKKDISKGGSLTIQDRLRLETLRAEVEARLSVVSEAEQTALAGIRTLTGDPKAKVDSKPLAREEFPTRKNAKSAVQTALKSNPKMRAGRLQSDAAREITTAQKRNWWPNLLLLARFNIARAQGVDDPPSAFANDPFNVTSLAAGLFMQWDLDPWGQTAKVKGANARVRQALQLVKAGESALAIKTQSVLARIRSADRRITTSKAGVKSAKAWVASVIQGEALGVVAPKDLADAYIAYFTVKSRLLESLFDWNVANYELLKLLGEFPLK